jgi:ketosteroid isomerase-like protein
MKPRPKGCSIMTDTTQVIEGLVQRVQVLEDERAIHRTLVRYGFAVDGNDAEALVGLYTDDTVIEIDGTPLFHGSDGARALINSEAHQAILPNCAHMIGPLSIEIDGDRAVAVGYACVVVREGDALQIWREGCNRWELERRPGAWRIAHRQSYAIGDPGAQEILRSGL